MYSASEHSVLLNLNVSPECHVIPISGFHGYLSRSANHISWAPTDRIKRGRFGLPWAVLELYKAISCCVFSLNLYCSNLCAVCGQKRNEADIDSLENLQSGPNQRDVTVKEWQQWGQFPVIFTSLIKIPQSWFALFIHMLYNAYLCFTMHLLCFITLCPAFTLRNVNKAYTNSLG